MRHTLVLVSTAASLAMAAPAKFGVTGSRPWNKVVEQDLAPHNVTTRSLVEPDCLHILRNADPKVLKALYKESNLAGGDKQDLEVCHKLVARMTPLLDEDEEEDGGDCEDPTPTASPTPTPTSGDGDEDCDPEEPTPPPSDPNDCDDDGDSDDGDDDGDDDDCSDDGSDDGDDDDCSDDGSDNGDDSDDEGDCDDDSSSTPTSSSSASTSTPTDPPSGGGESSSGTCSKKYTVVSGDTCSGVAQKYGISLSDFYTWNPDVDSDCQNLDIGQSYCVN